METAATAPQPTANWVLACLPCADLERLLPALEPVFLSFGQVLYDVDEPITHAHFPCGGLVSLLAVEEAGRQTELAVVGKEGVVGLPLFLGSAIAPYRTLIQGAGPALRMKARLFRDSVRASAALTGLLLRYTDAFFVEASRSAVCDHLHSVQQRLCRWLLMAQDRLGSDRLPYTQQFMANILAVRLASVSEAARPLQKAGIIRYSRGDLRILDRAGLERACCGCYRVIKDRFEALRASPG